MASRISSTGSSNNDSTITAIKDDSVSSRASDRSFPKAPKQNNNIETSSSPNLLNFNSKESPAKQGGNNVKNYAATGSSEGGGSITSSFSRLFAKAAKGTMKKLSKKPRPEDRHEDDDDDVDVKDEAAKEMEKEYFEADKIAVVAHKSLNLLHSSSKEEESSSNGK